MPSPPHAAAVDQVDAAMAAMVVEEEGLAGGSRETVVQREARVLMGVEYVEVAAVAAVSSVANVGAVMAVVRERGRNLVSVRTGAVKVA